METTTISPYFSRIAELWREGKTVKEISEELRLSVNTVCVYASRARVVLGEAAVPRRRAKKGRTIRAHHFVEPKPRTPISHWEKIAALWAEGKTCLQVGQAFNLRDPLSGGVSLVTCARRHLGAERVPHRTPGMKGKDGATAPKATLSMSDMGRHYLRKISNEFIFRDEAGREEVWVEAAPDQAGIAYRNHKRLAFKSVMGMTEKRMG